MRSHFTFEFDENTSDMQPGDSVLIHSGSISSTAIFHGYVRAMETDRIRVSIPLKNLQAKVFEGKSWIIDRFPSDVTAEASHTALYDYLTVDSAAGNAGRLRSEIAEAEDSVYACRSIEASFERLNDPLRQSPSTSSGVLREPARQGHSGNRSAGFRPRSAWALSPTRRWTRCSWLFLTRIRPAASFAWAELRNLLNLRRALQASVIRGTTFPKIWRRSIGVFMRSGRRWMRRRLSPRPRIAPARCPISADAPLR